MIRTLILTSLLSLPAYATEKLVVSSSATRTAVVELYTSEGCSSCPPADQWLAGLSQMSSDEVNVLALSFHVDYWDYLGWKDRFASPEYTSRQHYLGANNLQRTIYTPEFFVNGKESRGSNKILENIQLVNRQTSPLALELSVAKLEDSLILNLLSTSNADITDGLELRYIVYEDHLSSDVTRGENSGEKLKHRQVVRYLSPAKILRQQNHYRVDIDPDWQRQNLGVAVLVTSTGENQYLQALHTPLLKLLQ